MYFGVIVVFILLILALVWTIIFNKNTLKEIKEIREYIKENKLGKSKEKRKGLKPLLFGVILFIILITYFFTFSLFEERQERFIGMGVSFSLILFTVSWIINGIKNYIIICYDVNEYTEKLENDENYIKMKTLKEKINDLTIPLGSTVYYGTDLYTCDNNQRHTFEYSTQEFLTNNNDFVELQTRKCKKCGRIYLVSYDLHSIREKDVNMEMYRFEDSTLDFYSLNNEKEKEKDNEELKEEMIKWEKNIENIKKYMDK